MEDYDTFSAVAERLDRGAPLEALGRVGLTTLSFGVPPKEHLYRTVRAEYSPNEEPIKLNPSVDATINEIDSILSQYEPQSQADLLSTEQLSWFVGTMYQFSDRNGLSKAMSTPYKIVQDLHDAIVDQGTVSPVVFSDQLKIALENAPNVPAAVWNLFLTSRQLARMRDGAAIAGFPDFSKEEKLEQMKQWERSVAAVKPPDETGYQDAAGDTYYVWTHALARIIYRGLPEKRNPLTRGYETAFWYGSHVMTSSYYLLGRFSVLGTQSNHLVASRYGNAIGDKLVDAIR